MLAEKSLVLSNSKPQSARALKYYTAALSFLDLELTYWTIRERVATTGWQITELLIQFTAF